MPHSNETGVRHLAPDLVLEVWQRRKWLACVTTAATLAATVTGVLSLPNLYRATATVIVERQHVSEAFVRPSVTAELETRIQTIHQQVMSRAHLTDVIAGFDLYPELSGLVPADQMVERMRREIQLALKGVDQTSGRSATIAFTLSYTGRNPHKLAEVVNALAALYVEENTKTRERQATRTAEFLKAELAEAKQNLDGHERRVAEFKQRHAGELLHEPEVNLAALDRLNTQLRLNGEYQVRAVERRERLERELAEVDAPSPRPATPPDTPEGRLSRLRQELAELRRRFSDRYPDVVRVQAEIAALERVIEHERAGNNGDAVHENSGHAAAVLSRKALAEVDRELVSLKNEEQFLRRAIAGYEARLENAPRRQQELQQLTGDSATTKERYEALLKRFEEARLAEDLERGQNVEQFRVLDPALPPARPVAPNRPWLLAMGLVASLAVGLGAMLAAERLDTTFHTVDDLKAFMGVAPLVALRRIRTNAAARRRRLRVALAIVASVAGLALIVAGSYYVASGNEGLVRLTARAGT